MIHPDYIRIYSARRRTYDIGYLTSTKDRLNNYATMSDLSLGAHVGIVRKRNALKYNKSRWRWVYGSFRPLWKGPR